MKRAPFLTVTSPSDNHELPPRRLGARGKFWLAYLLFFLIMTTLITKCLL